MQLDSGTLTVVFAATSLVALVALSFVLSRKGRTEDEARAYLAGVTYVLSGDPDAAISELSRAAQLSRQTLETYFAMGALFRRKGEFDRAIRLHRNILLRPGLSPEVKRRARLALALDYKRSGLRDQAAEALSALISEDDADRDALLLYRQVLEEQREWAKAIEVQTKLIGPDGKGHDVLAHLLAELARQDMTSAESEAFAARAVQLYPRSADAQLALGEILVERGKAREAAAPLMAAARLQPELAPRVAPLLASGVGAEEAERFLREESGSRGAPFELALARHLRQHAGPGAALGVLRPLVDRHPRYWDARKELGRMLLDSGPSEALRADYREILDTLGQPTTAFVCASCGQKLPEHVFRCPACETWDSVSREGAITNLTTLAPGRTV